MEVISETGVSLLKLTTINNNNKNNKGNNNHHAREWQEKFTFWHEECRTETTVPSTKC